MPSSRKTTTETLQDLWDLLRAYAKQETVDPLRNLGRSLGLGVAGSILLSLGLVYLSLAALRALQTEVSLFSDTWSLWVFDGDWSWAPYLIVLAALAVVIGVLVATMRRAAAKEEL